MPQTLTPEQAKAKQERRQAQVGLASNALGLTAGTAGLAAAAKNPALRTKPTKTGKQHIKPPMVPKEVGGPVTGRLAHKLKTPKARGRLILAGAAGATALQAANIGGDVVANRVLARSAQEPGGSKPVKKSFSAERKAYQPVSKKQFQQYHYGDKPPRNQSWRRSQGDPYAIDPRHRQPHWKTIDRPPVVGPYLKKTGKKVGRDVAREFMGKSETYSLAQLGEFAKSLA